MSDERDFAERERDFSERETATQITELLQRWGRGEEEVLSELMEKVYDAFDRMARAGMRREAPGHTLETGALINEAFLRLVHQDGTEWQDRAHFYGIAARTMRQLLVDHARERQALKRGGGAAPIALDQAFGLAASRPDELLAVHDALEALAHTDPERARLVEMRFFGGYTHAEIAELEGVSVATIDRQWRLARAWLRTALGARS